MGHGGDIRGVPVSEAEVAQDLGFSSVKEMDRFYDLLQLVEPKVVKSLNRWFGDRGENGHGQIAFEVAQHFVQAQLQNERATVSQRDDLGELLGKVLQKLGVTADVLPPGPELMCAAETYLKAE